LFKLIASLALFDVFLFHRAVNILDSSYLCDIKLKSMQMIWQKLSNVQVGNFPLKLT